MTCGDACRLDHRLRRVPRMSQRLASSSRTGGGAGWLAAVPATKSAGDSSCLLRSGCVAVLGRCIGSLLVLLTDAARSAVPTRRPSPFRPGISQVVTQRASVRRVLPTVASHLSGLGVGLDRGGVAVEMPRLDLPSCLIARSTCAPISDTATTTPGPPARRAGAGRLSGPCGSSRPPRDRPPLPAPRRPRRRPRAAPPIAATGTGPPRPVAAPPRRRARRPGRRSCFFVILTFPSAQRSITAALSASITPPWYAGP